MLNNKLNSYRNMYIEESAKKIKLSGFLKNLCIMLEKRISKYLQTFTKIQWQVLKIRDGKVQKYVSFLLFSKEEDLWKHKGWKN